MRITGFDTVDLRFPTSRELDGSDAMNKDPDYSAAYLVLRTDDPDTPAGYGFAFTIGRGNDVQTAAIDSLRGHLVGRDARELFAAIGDFNRELLNDSQLRWLGPEKGVIHMAVSAVLNAVWDLYARHERKPLWRLLSDLAPERLVDCVDFRYLEDALTPDQALEILHAARENPARDARERALLARGYPAYTTSPGWLGYSDEKLVRLSRQAVADGFEMIKLKVGDDLADDRRRMSLARAAVGPDLPIAVDANQRWGSAEAIRWMTALAEFRPYWIEEPTSPDDVLAHAAVRRALAEAGTGILVATGEHVHNRVMFKQYLQAGALDVMQIDAARVGGVNENIANLLLAARFGVPVCPHAGGVGLCELVQHLSMFDYLAVSGSQDGRRIEYVDHLHEHFTDPVVLENGRYRAPLTPGSGARIHERTLAEYRYPDGPVWAAELAGSAQPAADPTAEPSEATA
ncbi:enolase C-terminal domain-like protein [Phaeacidiphilus oryzae]|uniref:enolase C-terminal domain-like protein n=1 Tax=Phaeacidiphilus oryzae TaxID=348818 RepID=UPI00055F3D7D|nr:enolase C-terminal domain-like protein [Phaeacidiphilus oryzae]